MLRKETGNVNCNLNIIFVITNFISFSLDNSSEKSRKQIKKVVNNLYEFVLIGRAIVIMTLSPANDIL